MSDVIRVLIVEDSIDDTFFIVRELQRGGFEVKFERVETAASMQAALEVNSWDVIISDYRLPQFGGPAAFEVYQKAGLDIPFIVVSGAIGEDVAVDLLKSGVHDCVMKDKLSRLAASVGRELRAADERRIRRETEMSTAFLASLVESCDDAIVGIRLDGTVVSWNAGAEDIYGYNAGEMIGRSISALFPHYRPEELPELLERISAGERVHQLETVRMRKDGAPVEVSLTVSPVRDPGGRIIGASTVARDITQRKEEEKERLALIQDLTSALARVNSLAGRTES